MNLNDHISTELLFVTAPLEAKKGGSSISSGTSFIISIQVDEKNTIPILVTNHHVIKGSDSVSIEFFTNKDMTEDNNINDKKITVELATESFSKYMSEILDIAFIPIGPILEKLAKNNVKVFFKSIDKKLLIMGDQEKNLEAIEEVIFIGYPYGLEEISNKLPIVRRGITATPVWSNHNPGTFLIDAGVFPGSSGSPVFIYQKIFSDGKNAFFGTRLIFLGMIKGSFFIGDAPKLFIGIGETIKAKKIFEFIEEKLKLSGVQFKENF